MKFIINNKEYDFDKEITFEELLKMEKHGVALTRIEAEPFNQAINLGCYALNMKKDDLVKEVNEHFKNGGKIENVLAFLNILTESDFFK